MKPRKIGFLSLSLLSFSVMRAQSVMKYSLSMPQAEKHLFNIELHYNNTLAQDTIDFYMPRWTPGYYQIIDFGNRLRHFSAINDHGQSLAWQQLSPSHWQVISGKSEKLSIHYQMLEDSNFVAQSYLDSNRAYILPTNLFLYHSSIPADSKIELTIDKRANWPSIYGTGLDLQSENAKSWTFSADCLDDFYDSPVLLGKLDSLSSFTIHGIAHQFVGYRMSANAYTDRLMSDLKKIVTSATDLMQDVPYKKYVFLGIGPGQGGIEHLNSAAVSFSGESLKDEKSYLRMLSFLTHEYFHNFNVKRIRPIELGPFDYQTENRTHQLWISEGLTVFYENELLYRTGFYNQAQYLQTFADAMDIYENKPGHLIQSLASSSWNTWSDGPFGNLSDTAISYYDKGPVIGLLFDGAINHYSHGKYNLDSVMFYLYQEYYQKRHRGFTDSEFKQVAIQFGTEKIKSLFDYIYTAKPVDYNKYLAFSGWQLLRHETSNGQIRFEILPKD